MGTNSEFARAHTLEIEVVSMGHRDGDSKGERGAMATSNSPRSPNTDVFESTSPRNEIRRRMSTSAAQSVQMKVFRVCDVCTPRWMAALAMNESVYNSYLLSELVVESLPLLLLNIVDILFVSEAVSTVALSQAICASTFLVYSWVKLAYYVRFHEWNLNTLL